MKKIIITPFVVLFVSCFLGGSLQGQQQGFPIKTIWDKAPHNAFPDLIRFKNYFYAAVREGNNHMPDNSGQVRLLRSKDGNDWEDVGLLEKEGYDVREARLSVTPEGTIMVLTAVGIYEDGYQELFPMVSFSNKKGMNFSDLEPTTMDVTPSLDWIWSLTWHKKVGYGVVYQIKEEGWEAHLLKTKDGRHFQKVSQIDTGGNPNEATVRFDSSGKMYVLVRRETEDRMGVIASSEFPYQDWSFEPMNIRLGGPNFLFLDKQHLVVGSRYHTDEGSKTAVFTTGLDGTIRSTIVLPSGGDTSYPGMVFYKDKLWVMYYSSHEQKSKIYLTQIPIHQLNP
ncbi:glycoside hydrolase family protein [Pleomorphovibrio marinus]|uniref:hypothetical protein n=1 Tax=Pleomorphovibrio marinus TaxID=2164132 RepID=UPI001E3E9160|nr:hypothetical protein [Pleomorphovibrio marinus]